MAVDRDLLYAGPADLVKIGGVDIGGTVEGVNITAEQEMFEYGCDQIKSPVKRELVTRKVIVTFQMGELSLANLRLAFAQPAGNLSGDNLYITDGQMAETTMEIQVPTPDGLETRIYYFLKCEVVGNAEHSLNKGAQTTYSIEIACYPDTDNSDRIGYVNGDNT